jgi:hypothetical protein
MKPLFPLMIASLLAFLGCGGNADPDFNRLLEKAMHDLESKTASHQAVWGLGSSARWNLNQDDGKLVFSFPDKTVTCEAQIIGSYDKTKGSWLWAWDNPSIATNLTQSSRKLREFGVQKKIDKLTRSEWPATERDCWEMAALANLLCEGQGVYRGPAGDLCVFMTFGPPRIEKR